MNYHQYQCSTSIYIQYTHIPIIEYGQLINITNTCIYLIYLIMVKYLLRSSLQILLIIALVVFIQGASKAPVPTCNSPSVKFLQFPISLKETQDWHLNNFFSGYNLNLTIPDKPDFVYLRDKIKKTKDSPKDQPGLRNYNMAHKGNSWGNQLVTISSKDNNTYIRWGASSANQTIPELTNQVVIQNQPQTICFDAVWFRSQMIIMVDCVTNGSFGQLQNVFIYMNATSKESLGRVKNDMYVNFKIMRHRKISLHREDGYTYLIRAYLAEFVDPQLAHNTYLQILAVFNPLKPWTIRVMDRSFLQQTHLSLTDFQVYLGDIYVLDYHSGVIKFDITAAQIIVIDGRYRTDSGFTKLGVYSNNLDNQFLIVLAHDHAIIQIDWSNQIKPALLAKYSIPEAAQIHDIWVNEQYVVAQLSANLSDDKNATSVTKSTYIFTRGSRTYLNAFAAIPHPSSLAWVDFNRHSSQIMTFNTQRIAIYDLASPIMFVSPDNSILNGTQFSFTVKAQSKNEYISNVSVVCTMTFQFMVVNDDSMTIWPTGLHLPEVYYANYPGRLFISLDRYVLGPNITYGILDQLDKHAPSWWILQQNSTIINWAKKKPSLFKITKLKLQKYDDRQTDQQYIFVYIQDASNTTHFVNCRTIPYTDAVDCDQSGHVPHIDWQISNLTANRFYYYEGNYLHLVAIMYEAMPNQVFIYDVDHIERGTSTQPIILPTGYQGLIHSVQFLGKYLVIVLKYVKQIIFFDMVQCHDHQQKQCIQMYRINATMMDKLGVSYFSPVRVYASDFHPQVLFIQCLDRVIIIDVTRNGPILLAEVMSPATQEFGLYKWQMSISKSHLILVNPPNTIEQHALDELYTSKIVKFKKRFPCYHYIIPDKFDLDVSDYGTTVYITATDPKMSNQSNSVILVYRTGFPSVASFYDVYHINAKYDDMIIDATGNFGDYIAVSQGSMLTMFRQYQVPYLVFEDTFSDYSFNLTYTNDPKHQYHYLSRSTVKIANYPENIVVNNSKLNDSNYLGSLINYTNKHNRYYFDDYDWFNGSVLNYTLRGGEQCSECNKKLKVINHMEKQGQILGTLDMQDYAFSLDGGYIQQYQSIIKMRHNGSINQFIMFPSVFDGEMCISIQHSWMYDYTLSACKHGLYVYLYTTTYSASKPFVNGPYQSTAKHVTSMHVMEELMIIVDVDQQPFSLDREGGVIIYAFNHHPDQPQLFDQLEFIDTSDLSSAHDWPEGKQCFIGNAHFVFTNVSDTYRLVITQLLNGLFVMDFRWTKGRKSVQIIKLTYINLNEQLLKINLPMPNGAFFTAVAINRNFYDKINNNWMVQVLVVTSHFHTFQINMHIDQTGTVVSHNIAKVYYRYGFYQNQNYIKSFDGYFVIAQKLPVPLEIFKLYSQQVLAVYDTQERWSLNSEGERTVKKELTYLEGTKIPVQYMHGGYRFNKGRVAFDFNITFVRNRTDPLQNISLLAVHNKDSKIYEFRLHSHVIIQTQQGIMHNQHALLRATNDYHYLDLQLIMFVPGGESAGMAGWAIVLIVIGSVAMAALAGYVLYVKFVKIKHVLSQTDVEKSLLQKEAEEEEEGEDDSQDEGEDQGEDNSQDKGEDTSKEQVQQGSKVKVVSVGPTAQQQHGESTSINRETISSVAEQDKREQVEPEQPNADQQ